jgi:hypothetical protein
MNLSRIYDGGVYKFRFAGLRSFQSGSSSGGPRLGGARVLMLLIHVAFHSGVCFGQVFANIIH